MKDRAVKNWHNLWINRHDPQIRKTLRGSLAILRASIEQYKNRTSKGLLKVLTKGINND
jgi:hypothetical protein